MIIGLADLRYRVGKGSAASTGRVEPWRGSGGRSVLDCGRALHNEQQSSKPTVGSVGPKRKWYLQVDPIQPTDARAQVARVVFSSRSLVLDQSNSGDTDRIQLEATSECESCHRLALAESSQWSNKGMSAISGEQSITFKQYGVSALHRHPSRQGVTLIGMAMHTSLFMR